jgi:hypothetical protein
VSEKRNYFKRAPDSCQSKFGLTAKTSTQWHTHLAAAMSSMRTVGHLAGLWPAKTLRKQKNGFGPSTNPGFTCDQSGVFWSDKGHSPTTNVAFLLDKMRSWAKRRALSKNTKMRARFVG